MRDPAFAFELELQPHATDGDVQIAQRVTGRRTGECPPETEGDTQTNAQEG